jgi:hypothetical protein
MSEKILKEWLSNINNKKMNKAVLFIDDCYSKYKNDILGKKDIEIITPYSYKASSINKVNIIIFLKDDFNKTEQINEEKFLYIINQCVKRGIIYIKNPFYKNDITNSQNKIEFSQKIINFLIKEKVDISDIEVFYLEKKEFDDFQNMDKNEFTEFIKFREKILFKVYLNIKRIHIEYIDDHIILLFEKKLLTAKLAHHFYRLSELDFYSTTTFVGNEIRKKLGIKSKTINNKMIAKITEAYTFKNFKAYDLNIDKNLELKKKIAQKLLLLSNSKKLDEYTIAKVTELPLKEVKKLLKK